MNPIVIHILKAIKIHTIIVPSGDRTCLENHAWIFHGFPRHHWLQGFAQRPAILIVPVENSNMIILKRPFPDALLYDIFTYITG